jgi:hypothetical protein
MPLDPEAPVDDELGTLPLMPRDPEEPVEDELGAVPEVFEPYPPTLGALEEEEPEVAPVVVPRLPLWARAVVPDPPPGAGVL